MTELLLHFTIWTIPLHMAQFIALVTNLKNMFIYPPCFTLFLTSQDPAFKMRFKGRVHNNLIYAHESLRPSTLRCTVTPKASSADSLSVHVPNHLLHGWHPFISLSTTLSSLAWCILVWENREHIRRCCWPRLLQLRPQKRDRTRRSILGHRFEGR